jgi:hypothetical protein
MEVRAALTSIARQGAVSVVAGLIVSAFAAAVLVLGTAGSADRLAVGRTLWGSLAPVFAAVSGAGVLAGVVVFACLIANDVGRSLGPWLVAQRRWILAPLHAFTLSVAQIALVMVALLQYVARSPVFLEMVWLVRTVAIALGLVLYWAAIVGVFVGLVVGMVLLGFFGITESTRVLVAMLDDPPRPLGMALGIGAAFALMYLGTGALALCGWLAWRVTRAGLRRSGAVAP